jgi:ADP-heptose:LPS heptosyltransferase/GT2 family glycosyltransferase/predicted SAM-dependent methyltransferase
MTGRLKTALKRAAYRGTVALGDLQRRLGARSPRYRSFWERTAGYAAYAMSGEPFAPNGHAPHRTAPAVPSMVAPQPTVAAAARRPRRIQVVRRHAIGDVLLTTPVLRALRARWPDCHVTFVTIEPDVLVGNPNVDQIVSGEAPIPGDFDAVHELVYELQPERPIVEVYAEIAGVVVDDPTPDIHLTTDERARALAALRAAGADPGARPVVGFHMHSGWPVRDWPLDRFAATARALERELGAAVVVLGKEATPAIDFGVDLRGRLGLRETAAAIGFMRALVSVDSSLGHLAVAAGVPVVGLFGCTDPEKRYPAWARKHVLTGDVPCLGCHHRQRPVPAIFAPTCPFETVRCMESIGVDAVVERLRDVLADRPPTVSIVVPHYDRWPLLEGFLAALHAHPPRVSYEVIVVDDDSKDATHAGLAAWGPLVRVVQNRPGVHNFGVSCNRGAAAARGRLVAFVNNDTIPLPGWLDALVAAHDEGAVGIVGSKLLYPDGTIQHCGMAMNEQGVAEHLYRCLPGNLPAANRVRAFRAVTGACLLVGRDLFRELGGFDEGFRNGGEDTDLCFKVVARGLQVLYCPTSVLVHLEGQSRGLRDLADPDDRFNRERLRARFPELHTPDLDDYLLLAEIEANEGRTWRRLADVPPELRARHADPLHARAGRYPFRLELGSGRHPHPGYLHLDMMADAPSLDLLHDVGAPLPFPDATVEEILANHVIEHLSWRAMPDFAREAFRVLLPGGTVRLRTPNLRFIAERYLEGRTTPEHPDDEAFIRARFGDVTPSLWAMLKLFSGQDYATNFHFACWDPETLTAVFRQAGFGVVSTERFGREFSPGEIQLTAVKAAPQ